MSGQRSVHVDDEARVAGEMARELDAVAAASHAAPPAGFADRVMAAVAREPLPQPTRAFGTALAARRLGAAIATVGDAWRVAIGGRAPLAVRAQALALVLVVAGGSLALAGGATVGAIDLFNATQPARPSPTTPQPSQLLPSPSPTPSPTPAFPGPTPNPEASDTPEPTEDGGGATQGPPTATPRPTRTEDHGGATAEPTATGTDDHHDDGSSGGGTPQPTGTDDHSGGDG